MLKKNTLLIILITFTIKSFSQREFKTEVFEQAINNLDEFIEFLSYPNDANYESDIYKLMDWTENKFKSLDFKINRLDTETIPLMLASKHISDDHKTVLIYMHLDGQPVDLSKWNQENPFIPVYKLNEDGKFVDYDSNKLANIDYETLEERDIRIFARASSDAKGPVMMLIQAMKFMNSKNIDNKFNLKLIMDTSFQKTAMKLHGELLEMLVLVRVFFLRF